jgi:tetratricopeptide (TPR) repeat protein
MFEEVKIDYKTVPEVFRELYVARKTGICKFTRGEIMKHVYFIFGMPIFATSSDPNDRTGRLLIKMRKITPEELELVLAESRNQNKKLCTLLVEKGKLTPDELIEVVLRQVENIILSVFEWEEGKVEFKEKEIEDEDIITLNISAANVIMEGVRTKFTIPRLKKVIQSPWNVYKLSDDPRYRFRELRLKPYETKIISSIDGKKNLCELQEELNIPDEEFLKSIGGFSLLKLIEKIGEKESGKLPDVWKEEFEVGKKSAEEYYREGIQFFQQKNFKQARDALEKAVELDPTNPEYLTSLGMCYSISSDDYEANYQAAIKAFKKAAELNPTDPRNFYYVGIIYTTLGKKDVAIKAFKKALELDPSHKGAMTRLKQLTEENA